MSEKIVTIEIDEQGNSSIDLTGFQGKGCADVARALQGRDVVKKTEKKREFPVETSKMQTLQRRG